MSEILRVRVYDARSDETETVALMPDLDSAVRWVGAVIDVLPRVWEHCDVYAVRPDQSRVLMLGAAGRMLTGEETYVVNRMIEAIERGSAVRQMECARRMRMLGWV